VIGAYLSGVHFLTLRMKIDRKEYKMKEMISCSVANSNCSAPAGWQCGGLGGGTFENNDKKKQARLKCFSCGLPVCGRCSRVIDYLWYGKQRICDNCYEKEAK